MQTLGELHDRTLTYWRVSKSFNWQSKEEIPTFVAIAIMNDVLDTTNPFRPLARRVNKLLDDIIVMKTSKLPHSAKVLQLKRG